MKNIKSHSINFIFINLSEALESMGALRVVRQSPLFFFFFFFGGGGGQVLYI